MISNLFLLVSILLNTAIAFTTTAFLIECALTIFRIKNYRTRASLRLFPFLSVILDRVFSEFSLVNWLNPLSCNSCMQKLLLHIFFPHIRADLATNDISLINYLAADHPHHLSTAIFIIFCSITAIVVLCKLIQAFLQTCYLRSIVKAGSTDITPITNKKLASALKKHHIKIIVSDKIHIPMASCPNVIMMPRTVIEEVSQDELEAIIAHELDHIRWKDPLSRLFSQLLAAIFWWIPTKRWEKKCIQDQEMACDQSILNYHFHSESLASALIKVTRLAKGLNKKAFCSFADTASSSMMRLHAMLGLSFNDSWSICTGFIGIGLGAALLLICMVWL